MCTTTITNTTTRLRPEGYPHLESLDDSTSQEHSPDGVQGVYKRSPWYLSCNIWDSSSIGFGQKYKKPFQQPLFKIKRSFNIQFWSARLLKTRKLYLCLVQNLEFWTEDTSARACPTCPPLAFRREIFLGLGIMEGGQVG